MTDGNKDTTAVHPITIVLAAACVILCLLALYNAGDAVYELLERSESAEHLVTWVAHVPNDRPDMELVTVDAENDIAYYRYVGEKVTPEVGDTLYLYDGSEVTVTSVTDKHFTVSSETPDVFVVGLSNTPVLNENEVVVGYVSTLLKNGQCQCIWR